MSLEILRPKEKLRAGALERSTESRCGSGAWRLVLLLAIAQSAPLLADVVYDGSMSGGVISPPVITDASGTIALSLEGETLAVDVVFSGLSGTSTGGHIHCCADAPTAAGVAILLPGFPTGVTSATYAADLDLGSAGTYQSGFVTACGGTALCAKATLLAGFRDGRAYLCVHSTVYPGSELRSYPDWVSFGDGFENGDVYTWSSSAGFVP